MFVLTWIICRVGLPRAVLRPKLLSSYICQDLKNVDDFYGFDLIFHILILEQWFHHWPVKG